MATKSFQTDFKLNRKAGVGLARAASGSKQVKHSITQPVRNIKKQSDISSIMNSFLGK